MWKLKFNLKLYLLLTFLACLYKCCSDIFFSVWQCLTWIESEMNFNLKSVSDLNWKNIARPKSYLFFWVIWSIKVSKNANFQNYFVASVFLVTLYQTHQNIHPLQYSVFEILSKLGFWEEKSFSFFSDYYKNWDISHIWNKIITENKSHITKTAYNQWKGKRK